jgi:NAD(P)H-dependent flavin oxidoreductase YrpB (nitropropane dioxygenase family)
MNTPACRLVGVDFPLFAFSHCRDVVAAVTNAGGFGVLGATTYTPDQLDAELKWIDDHVGGKPYGVDVLIPSKVAGVAGDDRKTRSAASAASDLEGLIPAGHREFVAGVLRSHGIDAGGDAGGAADDNGIAGESDNPGGSAGGVRRHRLGLMPGGAEDLLEVAFAHPIRLVANALGVPTPEMIERARAAGVPTAALVGTRQHAQRQMAAGVDLLVAQGMEAGGHTGEIGTMVLVPDVVDAVREGDRSVPVLAAGGIVTGRQMAAAMALGADGVWTGSVWLTTHEAETAPATKEKMLQASASDTVRSRSRTGKPSRQLRSAWTDAWESEGPIPLPMPLQTILTEPALRRIDNLATSGHPGARDLSTYWVGQGVGIMRQAQSVRAVVAAFMEECGSATERLQALLGD